jgi:para-aminobenzoate synthetase
VLVFCDRLIAFDHLERRVHLVALADAHGAPAADAWLAETESELDAIARRAPPAPPPAPAPRRFGARENRDAYLANIAVCKHKIFEGESYEICLTTELRSEGAIDPLAAYRALRAQPRAARRVPAPRDVSVLSSSRALPARRP